jgi:hypothetical protein
MLAAIVLLLAACVSSPDVDPTSSTTSQPEAGASAEDRLVTSTASGGVVVYDDSLDEVVRLSPVENSTFRQPTWLDSESIVYAEATDDGGAALVATEATSGSIIWTSVLDTPPFYYLPAPDGADAATTALRNDPSGTGLITELVGSDGTAEQLSDESPLYTSWSVDGRSLAIHSGQARITIRSDAGEETIAEPSGFFQAPSWTTAGLVTLRTTDVGQVLTIWRDGTFTDLALIEGPVRFVVSGSKIAIQSALVPETGGVEASMRTQTLPEIPGGRLVVVDIASAEIATVSNLVVPLFQWDPTGNRLLYATIENGEPLNLTWHIWTDETITDLSSFLPQPSWVRDLVPFFDQYAQSVSMWSSAGDKIAYPAVADGAPVVVVEAVDGSGTELISDATWAAWSPSQ